MFHGRFTVSGLVWANRVTGVVMLVFAGLLLALGGLYWLICDGDRRCAHTASHPDAPGPGKSQ